MKTTFDLIRVWAALTGLVLTGWYFIGLYLGFKLGETLPLLIGGIGGIELVLLGHDIWLKRGRQHG